jgi:hypothetical protein
MDMGLVNELFNPSAKHTEDERQRLEHTRVVDGDHGPGAGPVDLDSGAVMVVPPDVGMILPPKVRVEEQSEDEDEPEV